MESPNLDDRRVVARCAVTGAVATTYHLTAGSPEARRVRQTHEGLVDHDLARPPTAAGFQSLSILDLLSKVGPSVIGVQRCADALSSLVDAAG